MAITLADVASKAGVSKSTASRVLNGLAADFRISKPTVSLVEAAAKDLGYRPNYAAKALTSGRTHTIGMIGPLLQSNPWGQAFFAPVMAGISEQVRRSGFTLLFTQFNWHDMGLDAATTRQVEALIAPGFAMATNFTELDLEALPAPMALIDDAPVPTSHPVIAHDPTLGLRAAVDHLIELGHRKIAWIGLEWDEGAGPDHKPEIDRQGRQATFIEHMAQRGLDPALTLIVRQPGRLEEDRALQLARVAKDLLWERKQLEQATAFVCFNDLVAASLVRALRAAGRSVPEQASVVGVDNLWSDLLDPALTTVDMRLFEVGRKVGEVAIDIAEHPRKRDRWRGTRTVVDSELIVRGSTGPIPTAPQG